MAERSGRKEVTARKKAARRKLVANGRNQEIILRWLYKDIVHAFICHGWTNRCLYSAIFLHSVAREVGIQLELVEGFMCYGEGLEAVRHYWVETADHKKYDPGSEIDFGLYRIEVQEAYGAMCLRFEKERGEARGRIYDACKSGDRSRIDAVAYEEPEEWQTREEYLSYDRLQRTLPRQAERNDLDGVVKGLDSMSACDNIAQLEADYRHYLIEPVTWWPTQSVDVRFARKQLREMIKRKIERLERKK